MFLVTSFYLLCLYLVRHQLTKKYVRVSFKSPFSYQKSCLPRSGPFKEVVIQLHSSPNGVDKEKKVPSDGNNELQVTGLVITKHRNKSKNEPYHLDQ